MVQRAHGVRLPVHDRPRRGRARPPGGCLCAPGESDSGNFAAEAGCWRVSEGGRTDSAVGLRGDPGPPLCVPVFAEAPQF